MSLKLKRRPGRPHWYMHGTVRGVSIRESTGVADAKAAEAIRARREWEIIQRSVFGAEATATFVGAAVSYLEAGGERTYLKPIVAKIGSMPLAKIDQAMIEKTARALYPNASPATLNRQAYTPIAAVLNHAAKRGLCAAGSSSGHRTQGPRALDQIRGGGAADRGLLAASSAAGPAPARDWGPTVRGALPRLARVDLASAHVTFLDTKNGEARGVPLHARLVNELRTLRHRQGRVFRTNSGLPYAERRAAAGRLRPHSAGPAGGPG